MPLLNFIKENYNQFCQTLSETVKKLDTKTRLLVNPNLVDNFKQLEGMNDHCSEPLSTNLTSALTQVQNLEKPPLSGSTAIADLVFHYEEQLNYHDFRLGMGGLPSAELEIHNTKGIACLETLVELKTLRDDYQSLRNALADKPASHFNPILGPYSALTATLTSFLSEHLKEKKYAPSTQFIASQAAQLAMHLITSPDPKLTLATALPNIVAQATGVSKTKVMVASMAAYTSYMAYLYHYQPEACLTTSLNLVASLAGGLMGDMAGHFAYDRFVGHQYPARREKRIYDFRPRNEAGRAITESARKQHVVRSRI